MLKSIYEIPEQQKGDVERYLVGGFNPSEKY